MHTEIKALTGLRGLAATAVMIDHYAALDFTAPFPLSLLPHFYLAVDMFMVLSGFVLARSYEGRYRTLGPRRATALFLRNRIARLYPLYAVTTLVAFLLVRAGWLTFLHPHATLPALLANLLAVQTWFWPGTSLDGPAWSISAEWAANLLFPALLPLILATTGRTALAATAAALLVLVATAATEGQLFDVPTPFVTNMISGPPALGRCIPEFALGILCWRLRSRLPATRRLATPAALTAMTAALALLILDPRLDIPFVLVTAAAVTGLSHEASPHAHVLASPPLRFLGLISYSIYLVHIPLLPLRDLLAQSLPWPAAIALTATATILLATLTHHLLERPVRRHLAPA